MGRIVVSEFISLDGVIGDPAWSFDFDRGQEGDKYKLEELFASDALLVGRVTYQTFAEAWPSRTDEEGFADRMNGLKKYVVSSTLTDAGASWSDTTVLRGDPIAEITALRAAPDRDILVYGSGQLVKALLAGGLVDELRLMVFPVILGSGQRMFPDEMDKIRYSLADARPGGDGVYMLTYRLRAS